MVRPDVASLMERQADVQRNLARAQRDGDPAKGNNWLSPVTKVNFIVYSGGSKRRIVAADERTVANAI